MLSGISYFSSLCFYTFILHSAYSIYFVAVRTKLALVTFSVLFSLLNGYVCFPFENILHPVRCSQVMRKIALFWGS